MTNHIIAKDPIDYIRNFRFALYKSNPGSSAGPVCKKRNLNVLIIDESNALSLTMMLTPEQHKTTKVIADWLEKQPMFFIQPYAVVFEVETRDETNLHIRVNGFEANPNIAQAHLNDLVTLMDRVSAAMQAGDTRCIRPSYEPDPNDPKNQGGIGSFGQSSQVIGHIVLDASRTPMQQNRYPQGKSTGKDNW